MPSQPCLIGLHGSGGVKSPVPQESYPCAATGVLPQMPALMAPPVLGIVNSRKLIVRIFWELVS